MDNENTTRAHNAPHLPPRQSFSSRAAWEKACWRHIIEKEKLLSRITTASERHDIVMRAACLQALVQGKSYRDISRELSLSLQTISSVRHTVDGGHYQSYAESAETKKQSGEKHSLKKPRHYRDSDERRPAKHYIRYPRI